MWEFNYDILERDEDYEYDDYYKRHFDEKSIKNKKNLCGCGNCACECGAFAVNTTHSCWCPVYKCLNKVV